MYFILTFFFFPFIRKVQKSLVELEKLSLSGEGANLFLLPAGHDYQNKVLHRTPNYILWILFLCFYSLILLWVLIPFQVIKSQLFVDKFSESLQQTFLDYLAGGYEMNFMVAVDYTGN